MDGLAVSKEVPGSVFEPPLLIWDVTAGDVGESTLSVVTTEAGQTYAASILELIRFSGERVFKQRVSNRIAEQLG